jgi:hypothetical protein
MPMPDQDVKMYGCTVAALKECIATYIEVYGPDMMAMSWLSDAQEQMRRGDVEGARQTINRAKYMICEYWKQPR